MTPEQPTIHDQPNSAMITELMKMFADRERQRVSAVEKTLAALTDRERQLFREAAVMGYVQGVRDGRIDSGRHFPTDTAIVSRVISACLASGVCDLYPQINSVYENASRPQAGANEASTADLLAEVDRLRDGLAKARSLVGCLYLEGVDSWDGYAAAVDTYRRLHTEALALPAPVPDIMVKIQPDDDRPNVEESLSGYRPIAELKTAAGLDGSPGRLTEDIAYLTAVYALASAAACANPKNHRLDVEATALGDLIEVLHIRALAEVERLRNELADSDRTVDATRHMAAATNTAIRTVLLNALGQEDDGFTPLLDTAAAVSKRLADAMLWLPPDTKEKLRTQWAASPAKALPAGGKPHTSDKEA